MTIRTALPVLLFATITAAQTTHVVSGGGAALQVAINTAAPGDILDVLPASYTAVTATRGLRISLRAGASVTVPFLQTIAAITISSLPAGEAFVVNGGAVQGIAALGCAGAVVVDGCTVDNVNGSTSRFDNCTGPVACQGIYCSAPTFGSIGIANSAQVSFASCILPRTTVTSSHVTFANTWIRPYGGTWPTGGAPSLRIVSGSVSVAGGRIEGGVAASLPYHESGIELQQGDLVVTGGAYIQESILWSSPAVAAIATLGGTLRIDPSVTLVGLPPISGPAVVTNAITPSLAVARTPGSTNYQVTVAAEPGSLVFTLIGLPMPVLPSPFGDLWLEPQSPILDVSTMPAVGTNSFARSLANVPPFLVLVVQSAALAPAGTIAVSTPVRFVWD